MHTQSKKDPAGDPILHYLRILFSSIVCLIAAAVVSNILWSGMEAHHTHYTASTIFLVIIIFPFLAVFAAIISFPFMWLDRLLQGRPAFSPMNSLRITLLLAICTLISLAYAPLGAILIFLMFYRIMRGALTGWHRLSFAGFWNRKWRQKLYSLASLAISLPTVAVLIAITTMLGSMTAKQAANTYYSATSNAEYSDLRGTPPFQSRPKSPQTIGLRRALEKFPSPQSCLEPGARANVQKDLLRMDWDQITSEDEATVCAFRLLYQYGGVAEAQTWMEAQGFRVHERFSSANPNVSTTDNTLRVTGSWSVRRNGPRYPTTGTVRRILHAFPYGMGMSATFDPDGQELLYLRISFSTF